MLKIILMLLTATITLFLAFIFEQKSRVLAVLAVIASVIFSIWEFLICLLSIPVYSVIPMCSLAGLSILLAATACILMIHMLYHSIRVLLHPEYISVKELDTMLLNLGLAPVSAKARRKYRKKRRVVRQSRALLRDTISMTHFTPDDSEICRLSSKYRYSSINEMSEEEIVQILEWVRSQCIEQNKDLDWEQPTIYQQNLVYEDFSSVMARVFDETTKEQWGRGEDGHE